LRSGKDRSFMVGPGRHLPLLRPLLEATTASYVQYTDHRITVH